MGGAGGGRATGGCGSERAGESRREPCGGGEARPCEHLDGVRAHVQLSDPAPFLQARRQKCLSQLAPSPVPP